MISYTGEYGNHYVHDPNDLPEVSNLYVIDQFEGSSANDMTLRTNMALDGSGTHYLLYSQGGPIDTLGGFHDAIALGLTGGKKWSVLNIHQYQTLNPDFGSNGEVNVNEALRANSESAAILFKVAKHFSEQGKSVYIVSHSFGSFIVQKK